MKQTPLGRPATDGDLRKPDEPSDPAPGSSDCAWFA